MRLIYQPDAEAELIEAARFYERRVLGLGAQFLDGVDVAMGVIRQAPDRWRILESDIRRHLMPRFPDAIYYRAHPGELHIRLQASQPSSRILARPSYRLSRKRLSRRFNAPVRPSRDQHGRCDRCRPGLLTSPFS